MNVLLVNPWAPNIARMTSGFDVDISAVGRMPPLGLISLAAYIHLHSDHRVKVFDASAHEAGPSDILNHIEEGDSPSVIGISTSTYTFYDVLALARSIKRSYPDKILVLGGPHTSLFPRETLSHTEIDYLVIGEGEAPFLHLLNELDCGRTPSCLDGLAFRKEGFPVVGSPTLLRDLDSLPIPAYDLLDNSNYYSTFGRGGKTITLNSSRGCPFKCSYCQVLVKNYRMHSIDYMMNYIKKYHDQGYRNFYFFDDLFNITTQRTIEFSKRLRQERLGITWVFRGRVDRINEEVCREASLAGCVQILLGIEDSTDMGLAALKKNITMAQARRAIRAARSNGIRTSTNWILGLPSHRTPADLEHLLQTAIDLGGDYAMFSILALLPGCAMYDEAVAEGVLSPDAWVNFVLHPSPKFEIQAYEKFMKREELAHFYTSAYKRFYRRPLYIARELMNIRSFSEVRNQFRVALKVLLARG